MILKKTFLFCSELKNEAFSKRTYENESNRNENSKHAEQNTKIKFKFLTFSFNTTIIPLK